MQKSIVNGSHGSGVTVGDGVIRTVAVAVNVIGIVVALAVGGI